MGREFDGQMGGRMACRREPLTNIGLDENITGSEAFSQGEKQHLVARSTQIRVSGCRSSCWVIN